MLSRGWRSTKQAHVLGARGGHGVVGIAAEAGCCLSAAARNGGVFFESVGEGLGHFGGASRVHVATLELGLQCHHIWR